MEKFPLICFLHGINVSMKLYVHNQVFSINYLQCYSKSNVLINCKFEMELVYLPTDSYLLFPLDRIGLLNERLMTARNYQIAGRTQRVTTKTTVSGDQVRVERRVELRTERRVVDPKIYSFLHECQTWIQSRTVSLLHNYLKKIYPNL